ncbi:sodium-independent anion transporter [Pseudonocardia sulfidoxydans NBRC 16205]|uniref:Sodium-independent anion transporter n=1 Tax=Pseudonocardia sulfidoxydans NBRC 16205 TaxID=1223511 RepID=A0A511D8G1_9PSEU|nr:SulP family inorganic anion transporter [Pseudonocardia sulfidoxydans]GEL21080.1 sodium-independent anion transporter [Pseudonocardia sulfidoxydans NBRC 16205]
MAKPTRPRFRSPLTDLRRIADRRVLRRDLAAGVVLGIESVPDGLARGLLVGAAPLSGLYGYLFGMVAAAVVTATPLVVVQATGALAIIVADVDLAAFPDPARALATLTVLTGGVLVVGGLLGVGGLLRFVSTAVMTGFVAAVGVNIVLSQLGTLTGADLGVGNRLEQLLRLLTAPGRIDLASTAVGVVTVVLVVLLTRTRLGALGMVVAVVVGSALAALFGGLGHPVQLMRDLVDVPRSLPGAVLPAFGESLALLLPAVSLAFVGAVQGAAVSASVARREDAPTNPSRDITGQGVGNLVSGLFQGMPVGGSSSASSLAAAAGGRTRLVPLSAAVVMALVIVLLGGAVGLVAMPALAGLLVVVGASTVRPAQLVSVARVGLVQLTVLTVTFVLTMIVPLQYAVLVGVGLSIVLHVVRQSGTLVLVQAHLVAGGRIRESEPVAEVPAGQVVVLQPYGSIFFASAAALEARLPTVTPESRGSVVILRLRGVEDAGATFTDVLDRYAAALRAAGSRLVIVLDSPRLLRQLRVTGVLDVLGEENVYRGNEWVGHALRRAHRDAHAWVTEQGG